MSNENDITTMLGDVSEITSNIHQKQKSIHPKHYIVLDEGDENQTVTYNGKKYTAKEMFEYICNKANTRNSKALGKVFFRIFLGFNEIKAKTDKAVTKPKKTESKTETVVSVVAENKA